jgi:exonuclease SbcD
MRLLHVSDWHLGRLTYGEPRAPDHDAVLAEIVAIAREERPDLVLHTGDLFDAARPAYADMLRALQVLEELAKVAPVVVLAGNHDSPTLFHLFERLLGGSGRIRFVDKARAPSQGGILTYAAQDGSRLRLAALPFVHANRAVDAFEESSAWMTRYADRIGSIERQLGAGLLEGYDGTRDVLVFAAHLFVTGATWSGSERRIHITDGYGSHVEQVPTVSYAAFGHIHKPQGLPGDIGRYAGSPLELDFGEAGEEKSIVLVDAKPGRPAEVRTIPLRGGRPLRKLEGTLAELEALAPSVGKALCLVTVRTDAPTPGLSELVRALLPGATILEVHEASGAKAREVLTKDDLPTGADAGFEELFGSYLDEAGTRGAELELTRLTFAELLHAVEEEREPAFTEADEARALLAEEPT